MQPNELKEKASSSTKWSALGEGIARCIAPLTNMILARLLVPEAFGIVATITMLTSFADMFTEAGFQNYLIQHEFGTRKELHQYANVAFWTNMAISFFLWMAITVFVKPIAYVIGNVGYETGMIVACAQLPISSFSEIQRALYRRDFNFKKLCFIRIVTACIPLIVTVPLAFAGCGYWALIIGNLMRAIVYAFILTRQSKWKPSIFFSFAILKQMFSFSMWTLIEKFLLWLNTWIDIFFIGNAFDDYYLGIYKNSQQLVDALTSIITATTVPIAFSTLSRLQNDRQEFKDFLYYIQRTVAYLILPLGVGVFIFRDLAVDVMLGSQWKEAANVIGSWALSSSMLIVGSYFCIEAYRAMGRPKLSVLTQIINLTFLIPGCMISLKFGFWPLVYTRASLRLVNVVVGMIFMVFILQFRFKELCQNVLRPLFFTICMGFVGLVGREFTSTVFQQFMVIICCAVFYLGCIRIFAKTDWDSILNLFIKKKGKMKS